MRRGKGCLPGSEEEFAVEGLADGLEGREAEASSGLDNGADIGEERRPPLGPEAVGDPRLRGDRSLAEDRRWPQGLLGAVVRGRHLTIGDEDEEMGPVFQALTPQLDPGGCDRFRLE